MTAGAADSANQRVTVWGVRSTRTLRVHWTLIELGVDYVCQPVVTRSAATRSKAYRALNPAQKVPVLQHGELALTESAAIVSYLTDVFAPPEGFLVPRDAVTRARVNEWTAFVLMELDANSLYLMRRHHYLVDVYGEAPNAVAAAEAYFLKQLTAATGRMVGQGCYLMGNDFSTADILMMSCLDWAIAYHITLPPDWQLYRDMVAQRPTYHRAMLANDPEGTQHET